MSRKPPARRSARGAPVTDWHLWTEVKKTVAPLTRRLDEAPTDRDALEDAVNAPKPAPEPEVPPLRRPREVLRPSGPPAPAYRALYDFTARKTASGEPIEPNLKRRLAKGRLPIDATLDLHGMSQEQAHGALLHFISSRAARGDRTVLLITGKGLKKTGYLQIEQRGILRHAVPRWLAEPPLAALVAGVDAAHTGHGGEGALYVRLRRKAGGRR